MIELKLIAIIFLGWSGFVIVVHLIQQYWWWFDDKTSPCDNVILKYIWSKCIFQDGGRGIDLPYSSDHAFASWAISNLIIGIILILYAMFCFAPTLFISIAGAILISNLSKHIYRLSKRVNHL